MKFAIITQVPHLIENGQLLSYAPYIREMNIWNKYGDEVIVVAPLSGQPKSAVDMAYDHPVDFKRINDFNIQSTNAIVKALWKIPRISWVIFKAMRRADHIHLRCPGNIGLLGCFIQILFPGKPKTAKYAGNWDPKAQQPWSYKLQRRILSNTFLTRNMQVLVYGQWPASTRNIKPFFTATYHESDKTEANIRTLQSPIKIMYVGTLAHGKRPMHAARLAQKLNQLGHNIVLEMYGEGMERAALEAFIASEKLNDQIKLMGNQPESVVRAAYQTSHFLILPSQSEGWPKVVAEAMFWGCVPLASAVSCVPDMLGNGTRGVLLSVDLESDVQAVTSVLADQKQYESMAESGMEWSRKFTFDVFESEIKKILHG